MAKWIEYTGSDEHIEEMCKPGCIYAVMDVSGKVFGPYVWFDTSNHPDPRLREFNDLKSQLNTASIKQYIICEPHPYADLIKIWADTGCPVWVKVTKRNDWVRYIDGVYYKPRAMVHEYLEPTTKPDWNIPGAEYRLTPFED